MASYWLVVGTPEHWQVAFENGNIWGLQQVKVRWWDRLSEGDGLIFYVTRPIGGAIGLGKVSTKFKQDKPLWPPEVEAQRVLWPLRFEFDVDFCFRPEDWLTCKLEIDALRAIVQAGFQPLKPKTVKVALQAFAPFLQEAPDATGQSDSLHEELKNKLVEMGRIQKFLAEAEYATLPRDFLLAADNVSDFLSKSTCLRLYTHYSLDQSDSLMVCYFERPAPTGRVERARTYSRGRCNPY